MIRSIRRAVLAALLLGGAASPLVAQDEVVDKVIAVVGQTAITRSQLDEELFSRFPNQGQMPTDPNVLKGLRRALTDTLINAELLYQAAQKDTMVKVTEQEVSDAVEQIVRNYRKQIPSEFDFNKELRNAGFLGQDDWRRMLVDQQRRQLTVTRYRERLTSDGKLKPLAPTEKEMRAFYKGLADAGRLPPMPASVSLRQIVVAPQPTPDAKTRTKALADSIVAELRKGADFAQAARRFSQDPGSKESGGDLGWFRRGQMVREFEQVAFGLKPGVVSDPVESPFGYHIIQVQRVQPTEIQARHILLMPVVDSSSGAAAKARATEIFDLIAKGASFDSLQRISHDPGEEKEILLFPIDSLLQSYRTGLEGVDSGKVARPFELEVPGQPLRAKWAVVRVMARIPAGDLSFDAVKERIRDILGKQLGEGAYLRELRSKTYVDLRDP